jgi:hypothetical protein
MANTTGKKFGGRKKGTPNKTTSEIRALAQEYGPEAIRRLVSLMRQSDDRKVQFAAVREILNRGYGPPQEVVESPGDDFSKMPREEIDEKLNALLTGIEQNAQATRQLSGQAASCR